MKSSAVASVALLLGVCLASPLDQNELVHGSDHSRHPDGKYEQYGCDAEHTSSVWGPYIPQELQQQANDVGWGYNKYLANITKNYWTLTDETKQPGVRVNGLPAPLDRAFDVIQFPGGGPYAKMVNAKTQNLVKLQNKSLDIDFEGETALFSMASLTEKIHLVGQLVGAHGSEGSAHAVDCECDLTLKAGVRLQVLMDMKKDEQGHYRVSMNQCKFGISQNDDVVALCDKAKDGKDGDFKVQAFNGMAQLLCQQGYFEQVKGQIEENIRLWNPSKRAENWASTEIYKLIEKFRNEKLKNDIEVGYKCEFETHGCKVHFENVKIHGQEHGLGFHSTVPAAYTLDRGHHVDTMLMTYAPLTAEFTVRYECASGSHSSTGKADLQAPAKIALHFSTDKSDRQKSFSLQYHPDAMVGGIHSVMRTGSGDVDLKHIYGSTVVNVFIAYVQRELFDFLYPGALPQGSRH